jgi:hypothetical protein
MGSGSPTQRLRSLAARPTSALVTGESRPVVNRIVYALARLNDPAFVWVDLQPKQSLLDPDSPTALGWVPPDRMFLIEQTEEVQPRVPAVGGQSAPPPTGIERLPPVARRAIESRRARGGGAMVVAFPNADYARRFYGPETERVRPFVDAFREVGMTAVFASVASPPAARKAFEFVFDIRADSRARWEQGSLVCETAPKWGPLLPGESIPLRVVPEIASALT